MLGFLKFLRLRRDIGASQDHTKPSLKTPPQVERKRAHEALDRGNDLLAQGQLDGAVQHYREAVRLAPTWSDAYVCLGYGLKETGQGSQAIKVLEQALRLKPESADTCYMLGMLARDAGDIATAAARMQQALDLDSELEAVYPEILDLYFRMEKFLPALAIVEQAIARAPERPIFHFYRGNLLFVSGPVEQAADSYRRALSLAPDFAEAMAGLGNALARLGQYEEALAQLRCALALVPEKAAWHSDLLLTLQYSNTLSSEALFQEHLSFGQRIEMQNPVITPPSRGARPARAAAHRLRVGYVSGDLRDHPIAFFIEPVLQFHDRSAIEVFAYHTHPTEDNVTIRLRGRVEHWRYCFGMSDEALAEKIASDAIDVLVDLSGHTAYNRLPVFAKKPALVQMTWLGYQATTGLKAMDFRITDAALDPPGKTEAFHTEKLLRLRHGAAAFQPDRDSPPVNSLPSLSQSIFTFGCLNNPSKLTPQFFDAVIRILLGSHNTRMLLAGMSTMWTEKIVRILLEAGIALDRIRLVERLRREHYLQLHHEIDMALDSFPYNGGTTTLHAVWMGVPVLTIEGKMPLSRAGAAIMRGLDFGEFVCQDVETYIRKAIMYSENRQLLCGPRSMLRSRLDSLVVNQNRTIVKELESHYYQVWNQCTAGSIEDR